MSRKDLITQMNLTIRRESPAQLAEYGRVPIGFDVRETIGLDGIEAMLRGESIASTRISAPYWKDYDALDGNAPMDWPATFDVSRWIILAAHSNSERVGGAIVVADDPSMTLLGDCDDCALLWDIRIAPKARGQGIGSRLVRAAEDEARDRSKLFLRVETQQINVPACRFYQRRGFVLERATPGAYAELPDEIQLVWRKQL